MSADVPNATVAAEGWRIALRDPASEGSKLVLNPEVPAPAQAAADDLDRVKGVEIGPGVSLRLEGGNLPADGAVISRRLLHALPPSDTANLVYYDALHDAWIAVPTRVSTDRRTLRARVHHLSIWNDIQYDAGWLLDTRVDAPKCEGPTPKWVDDIVVLDDRNAPLRWCTGRDPKYRDLLVVKVRMNRSYGVRLVPAVAPAWTYDSLFQGGSQSFLITATLSLSDAFGRQRPKPEEAILLGGEEVDYGFTEAQVRTLRTPVLLRAELDKPEATAGLTYTALAKSLGGEDGLLGKQVAAVVTLVGVAQCVSDIQGPLSDSDFAGAAAGAFRCLKDNGEDVGQATASALATALPKADPKVLGRLGGKIGGKLWQVWATGEVFQIGTLLADRQLISNAFELHAFPKPLPRPDLSSAELSAEGLGAVHIGMTVADVRKLRIGVRVERGPYCDTWHLPGTKDVNFSVPHSSSRLESIFMLPGSSHAPRGVQTGDYVEEVQSAFAGELEVIPMDSLKKDYYRVYAPDRRSTLQFSVDRPTGEVEYIEVGQPGGFYYPDENELCA